LSGDSESVRHYRDEINVSATSGRYRSPHPVSSSRYALLTLLGNERFGFDRARTENDDANGNGEDANGNGEDDEDEDDDEADD
jgi:hypothetical protein